MSSRASTFTALALFALESDKSIDLCQRQCTCLWSALPDSSLRALSVRWYGRAVLTASPSKRRTSRVPSTGSLVLVPCLETCRATEASGRGAWCTGCRGTRCGGGRPACLRPRCDPGGLCVRVEISTRCVAREERHDGE